jgi:hypothetical protein
LKNRTTVGLFPPHGIRDTKDGVVSLEADLATSRNGIPIR